MPLYRALDYLSPLVEYRVKLVNRMLLSRPTFENDDVSYDASSDNLYRQPWKKAKPYENVLNDGECLESEISRRVETYRKKLARRNNINCSTNDRGSSYDAQKDCAESFVKTPIRGKKAYSFVKFKQVPSAAAQRKKIPIELVEGPSSRSDSSGKKMKLFQSRTNINTKTSNDNCMKSNFNRKPNKVTWEDEYLPDLIEDDYEYGIEDEVNCIDLTDSCNDVEDHMAPCVDLTQSDDKTIFIDSPDEGRPHDVQSNNLASSALMFPDEPKESVIDLESEKLFTFKLPEHSTNSDCLDRTVSITTEDLRLLLSMKSKSYSEELVALNSTSTDRPGNHTSDFDAKMDTCSPKLDETLSKIHEKEEKSADDKTLNIESMLDESFEKDMDICDKPSSVVETSCSVVTEEANEEPLKPIEEVSKYEHIIASCSERKAEETEDVVQSEHVDEKTTTELPSIAMVMDESEPEKQSIMDNQDPSVAAEISMKITCEELELKNDVQNCDGACYCEEPVGPENEGKISETNSIDESCMIEDNKDGTNDGEVTNLEDECMIERSAGDCDEDVRQLIQALLLKVEDETSKRDIDIFENLIHDMISDVEQIIDAESDSSSDVQLTSSLIIESEKLVDQNADNSVISSYQITLECKDDVGISEHDMEIDGNIPSTMNFAEKNLREEKFETDKSESSDSDACGSVMLSGDKILVLECLIEPDRDVGEEYVNDVDDVMAFNKESITDRDSREFMMEAEKNVVDISLKNDENVEKQKNEICQKDRNRTHAVKSLNPLDLFLMMRTGKNVNTKPSPPMNEIKGNKFMNKIHGELFKSSICTREEAPILGKVDEDDAKVQSIEGEHEVKGKVRKFNDLKRKEPSVTEDSRVVIKYKSLETDNNVNPAEVWMNRHSNSEKRMDKIVVPRQRDKQMQSLPKESIKAQEAVMSNTSSDSKSTPEPGKSPRKRPKRRHKYRLLDIKLTAELKAAYEMIINMAKLFLSLLQKDQIMPESHTVQSLTPDVTRFIVKQHEKTMKDAELQEPYIRTYRAAVSLHGLINAADGLLHCCLQSAINHLAVLLKKHGSLIGETLDPVYRRLQNLDHEMGDKRELHPKLAAMCKYMNDWFMNKHLMCLDFDPKILVIMKRDLSSLDSTTIDCIRNLDGINPVRAPLVVNGEQILKLLDSNNCIVLCGGQVTDDFPWSHFSLVIEYEFVENSQWKEICERQYIRFLSLKAQIVDSVSDFSTTQNDLADKENVNGVCKILCSNQLAANTELLHLLESRFNMALIERDYSKVFPERKNDFADLILDERTCLIIEHSINMSDDNNVKLIVEKLICLSLKFCTCYLLFYPKAASKTTNERYSFPGSFNQNLSKLYGSLQHIENSQFKVQVYFVKSCENLAACVSTLAKITMKNSKVWDKKNWSQKPWLVSELRMHEKFLLCFPCLNDCSAQILLSATPLGELIKSGPEQLITKHPWLPERFLLDFHSLLHNEFGLQLLKSERTECRRVENEYNIGDNYVSYNQSPEVVEDNPYSKEIRETEKNLDEFDGSNLENSRFEESEVNHYSQMNEFEKASLENSRIEESTRNFELLTSNNFPFINDDYSRTRPEESENSTGHSQNGRGLQFGNESSDAQMNKRVSSDSSFVTSDSEFPNFENQHSRKQDGFEWTWKRKVPAWNDNRRKSSSFRGRDDFPQGILSEMQRFNEFLKQQSSCDDNSSNPKRQSNYASNIKARMDGHTTGHTNSNLNLYATNMKASGLVTRSETKKPIHSSTKMNAKMNASQKRHIPGIAPVTPQIRRPLQRLQIPPSKPAPSYHSSLSNSFELLDPGTNSPPMDMDSDPDDHNINMILVKQPYYEDEGDFNYDRDLRKRKLTLERVPSFSDGQTRLTFI